MRTKFNVVLTRGEATSHARVMLELFVSQVMDVIHYVGGHLCLRHETFSSCC